MKSPTSSVVGFSSDLTCDIIFLAISATLCLCYMQCLGCDWVIILGFPPVIYPISIFKLGQVFALFPWLTQLLELCNSTPRIPQLCNDDWPGTVLTPGLWGWLNLEKLFHCPFMYFIKLCCPAIYLLLFVVTSSFHQLALFIVYLTTFFTTAIFCMLSF